MRRTRALVPLLLVLLLVAPAPPAAAEGKVDCVADGLLEPRVGGTEQPPAETGREVLLGVLAAPGCVGLVLFPIQPCRVGGELCCDGGSLLQCVIEFIVQGGGYRIGNDLVLPFCVGIDPSQATPSALTTDVGRACGVASV